MLVVATLRQLLRQEGRVSTSTNHFTFNCFLVQLLNNTDSFSTPRIPQIPHEDLSWHPRQRCYHQFQRSSLQSWNTGRCFLYLQHPRREICSEQHPRREICSEQLLSCSRNTGGGDTPVSTTRVTPIMAFLVDLALLAHMLDRIFILTLKVGSSSSN